MQRAGASPVGTRRVFEAFQLHPEGCVELSDSAREHYSAACRMLLHHHETVFRRELPHACHVLGVSTELSGELLPRQVLTGLLTSGEGGDAPLEHIVAAT